VLKKVHRSVDIKPQLLVGLAMDYLMIVQEFWVSLLLGSQKGNHFITSIKHIEATSPLAVNDNTLVIRDKLIVGLNAIGVVAVSVILEEGEFLVGHTKRWGLLYLLNEGTYFFKSIIISCILVTRGRLHILI